MKKIFKVIPAAILAFGAFTGMGISASASCHSRANTNSCPSYTLARNYNWNSGSTATVNDQAKTRHYFIDSNNNGICDSCADGICLSNGLCSSYYHDHGIFIDNNHDGICNHYAAGVCSYHHINGNFIANNNDGICNNCADGVCAQHGVGFSHHQNGHGCRR